MEASGVVRVSLAVRCLRAAVFAVLCVLLAAGGHVLATGVAPPVWVQAAGAVPVFLVGALLGGRERSLVGIGGGTLAAQGGLHLAFHTARPHAAMLMHGMRMSHSHPHALPSHALTPHALTSHATAAHIGAALLLTWWLRRGEAALWSLLRWAVAFVPGLAAWWQAVRGFRGASRVPGPLRLAATGAWPRPQVLLRYAVHRRGPPTGMSYAI
ncbi:hypothetical protein ACFWBB_38125 [Streptomyces sp. NPDC060000]|uniref:hypothetical protein n=1 Tax=Streptomyces sp. NPDC060000 TaxID=3347031 RepID=UPI00368C496E